MVVQSNRDTSNQAIYQNNDGVGTLGGLAALGGMGALAYMLLRKGKGADKVAKKAGKKEAAESVDAAGGISDKQLQQAKEYIAEKKKVIENGRANQTVAGLKKTADAKNGTNLADDVAAIKQKNAPQTPKRNRGDSMIEYMNLVGNLGNETIQHHIAHNTARAFRPMEMQAQDMYYSAVTGKTGAQVRSSMEAERNAIIPKVAPVTPTREIAKDVEKAKEVVKPVKQPKMDDVKKAEEVVKPKEMSDAEKAKKEAERAAERQRGRNEMVRARREAHEKEMVDPWYGVKNKEREKEKYDLIKSGHQSNSLHELDSDELVPVIHGGNTRVIEDFMNKKSGNTTLQSMPMPNAEKTSKQGLMFHSGVSDRADMYAKNSIHGGGEEEAILMGMVPRKYLYENDVTDEFSMPTWFGDKIQNPKIIKKSDPEYANHQQYYKDNYSSKANPWQKIQDNVLSSTVPGTKVSYKEAAETLGHDMSRIHPKHLVEFTDSIRYGVEEKPHLFSQTNTRKL